MIQDPAYYIQWLRVYAMNSAGFVFIALLSAAVAPFVANGTLSKEAGFLAMLVASAIFGWFFCSKMQARKVWVFGLVTLLYLPGLAALMWVGSFFKDLFVNSRFLNGPALAKFYELPSMHVPMFLILLATAAILIAGLLSSSRTQKRRTSENSNEVNKNAA
jgi:hypothetical protein